MGTKFWRYKAAVGVAGIVLLVSACAGEPAPVDEAATDVYVPGETRVVRTSTDVADRVLLGTSVSQIIELGPAATDSPSQHQFAVDSVGNVFVLDVFTGELRAFDTDGQPRAWEASNSDLLTLDNAPLTIGTVGDRILLANAFPGRLRWLDHDGNVIQDVDNEASPWRPSGRPDGTFIAFVFETGVVGRFDEFGEELARYTVFDFPEGELGGDAQLWAKQVVAVGTNRVFVTTSESHQVTAFDLDGASAWVLKGDAERIPIPDHISGRTLGRSRRAGRAAGATLDTQYADIIWPDFYPALSTIATDADGRLYVFPYVIEANPALYPVDVYDPNGTELARGWLPFQGWDAHSGNSVYRVETRDGMNVVVRYELTLPTPGTAAAQ